MTEDQAAAMTSMLQLIAKQQRTIIQGLDKIYNKQLDTEKLLNEPVGIIPGPGDFEPQGQTGG